MWSVTSSAHPSATSMRAVASGKSSTSPIADFEMSTPLRTGASFLVRRTRSMRVIHPSRIQQERRQETSSLAAHAYGALNTCTRPVTIRYDLALASMAARALSLVSNAPMASANIITAPVMPAKSPTRTWLKIATTK